MKQRVYIESSVVSYLVARPSKNIVVAAHQASTSDFWDRLDEYEVFVSDVVVDEVTRGDEAQAKRRVAAIETLGVLELGDEARALGRKLIADKIIPDRCPEDALHVAIAAANGMDVILTWNFRHMNNPFTRRRIRRAVEEFGWSCPEICSPEELLGGKT